jgi:SAM-dependent methyltransferase
VPRTEYWDGIADRWTTDGPDRTWRAYSDRVNAGMCDAWLPRTPVRRLLKTDLFDEVATSGLAPFLRERARFVVGIDHSLRMVQGARQALVSGVAADVRRLPFPNASFDRVLSNSTLDHFQSIDDLRQALRELARVLRPDGELLLTLDNMANPVLRLRNALPSRTLERLGLIPYRMGVSCRPAQLRTLCAHAGLEVITLGTTMHCPRVVAVLVSRLLDRAENPRATQRFFSALDAFERLGAWPTRTLTGHFVTVRARPQP